MMGETTMSSSNTSFKRKHYFIDRHFQGRYMLTFFIPMFIMLAFMVGTLYYAAITLADSTNRIIRQDIETIITLELQDQAEPSVERYKAMANGISGYLKSLSENREIRQRMITTLLWVFGTGLFVVMIQIVFMTVFFSHKIAGPVYRFENLCHSIIEGKYADQIKLRKGDELQNLAGLLNMVVSINKRRLQDLIDAPDDAKRREIASKLEL
jgi:nitrate/nitrite-specific signal transduction histidine kinase